MAHDTIEIYVRDLSETRAVEWLEEVFDELEKVEAEPIVTYEGHNGNTSVPVQITERVQGGPYTSLWFNAPDVPWESVRDCAREAHDVLGLEALCYLNRPDEPWILFRVADGSEEYVDKREIDEL